MLGCTRDERRASIDRHLDAGGDFLELRSSVQSWLSAGVPLEEIKDALVECRTTALAAGRERAADVAADALDLVYGWCSDHLKLTRDGVVVFLESDA